MANNDVPRGFIPYQNEGKVIKTRDYVKTTGINIYEGDLLMRVAAGTLSLYVAGTIEANGRPAGVAANSSLSTDPDIVTLYDDPEITYVVQCDSTTAYAAATIGLNADIAVTPVPDTGLSRSGMVVALAGAAVTATLPVKVLGLAPPINNEENSAAIDADLLVTINTTERSAGTVGI